MSSAQKFLATPHQIKTIHVLKSRAGLAEEDYRAALKLAGVESSKQFSGDEADAFISKLRGNAPSGPSGANAKPRAKGALALSGPYAGKLRALWIAGYDLGVVRDRTDKAMVAFLERQTGLSATNFVTEPREARKVIEALKGWLKREAKVDWTHARGADPLIEQRLAVVSAQWAILAPAFTGKPDETDRREDALCARMRRIAACAEHDGMFVHRFTAEELDQCRSVFGAEIRMVRRAGAAS